MFSRHATQRVVVFAVAFALIVSPSWAKRKKDASTDPGTYKEWKEDIDVLEIVSTFDMSTYDKIYVDDFDSSDTPRPDADDNTGEAVEEVLSSPEDPFVDGLSGEFADAPVTRGSGKDGLVVSVKVREMDPGSRSARYFAGFGAGAARARVDIEVKDGASGEVLLRIDQERRSGVGMGGGNYVKLMQRNLRQIGEDLALVLNAF